MDIRRFAELLIQYIFAAPLAKSLAGNERIKDWLVAIEAELRAIEREIQVTVVDEARATAESMATSLPDRITQLKVEILGPIVQRVERELGRDQAREFSEGATEALNALFRAAKEHFDAHFDALHLPTLPSRAVPASLQPLRADRASHPKLADVKKAVPPPDDDRWRTIIDTWQKKTDEALADQKANVRRLQEVVTQLGCRAEEFKTEVQFLKQELQRSQRTKVMCAVASGAASATVGFLLGVAWKALVLSAGSLLP